MVVESGGYAWGIRLTEVGWPVGCPSAMLKVRVERTRSTKENSPMRAIVNGFTGWARMERSDSESVQVLDAAITVLGTLLVALAWVMVRR